MALSAEASLMDALSWAYYAAGKLPLLNIAGRRAKADLSESIYGEVFSTSRPSSLDERS